MAMEYLVGQFGIQALKAGTQYGSEAFSGQVGMKVLNQVVNDATSFGRTYAGTMGAKICSFFGKAVAGQSLEEVSSKVKLMGETLTGALHSAIDAGTNTDATITQSSKYLAAAGQGLKALAIMGGGMAVASGIAPLGGVGLAFALADAAPKIVKAFYDTPTTSKVVSLVDDVFVPMAKNLAFEGTGALLGNFVRFNEIQKAYNTRVEQGTKIGELVGSYLPNFMKDTAKKIGAFAGTVDAGRFAMSAESIQKANDAAEATTQLVKGGLNLADAAISSKDETVTLFDKAKNVALITLGVAGGVALISTGNAVAPAIAVLSVADKVFSYAKERYYGLSDAKVEDAVVAKLEKVEVAKPEFAFTASKIEQLEINSEASAPAA